MGDVFHDYMSKRFEEINLDRLNLEPGPVITISRVAGCSSTQLAKMLAIRLNELNNTSNWNYISKDILFESAQKLKLNPKKIKSIFKAKDRTVLDDIMQAFLSNDNNLEQKMRKTVINVIHNFAYEGQKIIIGRAAHLICSDIKNALHIRIDAPLEWRIKKVMNAKGYSKDEALNCIVNTEKNRLNFRKIVKGKSDDNSVFDLTINQSIFSNNEIVEIIIQALNLKIKQNI